MSWIDEEKHPELFIFVEDKEAAILLREIISKNQNASNIIPRISITPAGAADVIKTIGLLAAQRRFPFPAMGILDGDQEISDGCICLPGGRAPERVVYDQLHENSWPNMVEKFGIQAGMLYQVLDEALLEPDHHRWNTIVGDRLLKSESSVWELLVAQWCTSCLPQELQESIVNPIMDRLE